MSNETNPVVGLVVPAGAGAFAFPQERIRFGPRRCRECGEGTISPMAQDDRVAVPTCDHCGNEYIDQETAEALDREIRESDAAFGAGADLIEAALGATPTVAEMTADLGKLTLPEVIWVKDCECASRPRFSIKAGDPTCEECGKAWTRTYGPSNDAPPEVRIEIRAAELAYSSLNMNTDEEWSGWYDYDSAVGDCPPPETDSNWAGWLSAAIEDHDQEHPPDGQHEAIRALITRGLL